MAALIVVGFVGTSLLKMGASDQLGAVLYSSSGSARDAAQSGITAAIHELSVDIAVDPDALSEMLVRLNAYIDLDYPKPQGVDSAVCYLKGGPNSWEDLSASQKYRVYIDGIDFQTNANCRIALVAEGMNQGGGKASAVAVYDIAGLIQTPTNEWDDMKAMYMEDGVAITFRAPIIVNGDIRLSDACTFGGNASGSTFNGKFRLQDDSNLANPAMDFLGEYHFNGNAYFGTEPAIKWLAVAPFDTGSFNINGSAGFKYGLWLDGGSPLFDTPTSISITGESWWLEELVARPMSENFPDVTYADFNGQRINHNNIFNYNNPIQINKGTNNGDANLDQATILNALDFPITPCELSIHPEIIPDDVIDTIDDGLGGSGSSLTATMLNDYPRNWNGFAVIKCVGQVVVEVKANDPLITNKVIILVPNGSTLLPSATPGVEGRIPDIQVITDGSGDVVAPPSGHITIINMGGDVSNWGGAASYRGLLYHQSGDTEIGGANNNGINGIFGAMYGKNVGTYLWHPKSETNGDIGGSGAITFDPTVFQELDVTQVDANGVEQPFIEKVNCGNTPNPNAGNLTASKITPTIMSQAL